ncbi:MAG: glycosyltransferase [Syntrophomonadaceae bacterium]|jgi:glycosyltransferase involved in cell wall biosynthesis
MSSISAILYPPTLDFNYLVQRPQQLMKGFAQRGIPVFYLNRPGPYQEQPTGVSEPYPNFYLFNQVDPALQQKGIRPVVYYSACAQVNAVHQYNPSLVVFDSVDEPSDEFEAWRPFYFQAVGSADVVIATSEKLYSMALGINPNTYLVPNGCEFDYFFQASNGAFPIPADIADIPKPIIGYTGVIASWLDLELIDRLAQEFSDCSIVMVGPLYNISDVPRRPNIHYLGFKPYEQLAAYEQAFDVGIVPFKLSSMVESVNPIKMWEYMAAGLPIVTTNIPEAAKYPEAIMCSQDEAAFLANVRRALYEDTPERRATRLAVARENSWLIRAQQIIEIIESHLAKRGAPAQAPPLPPIDTIPLRPAVLELEATAIDFREPTFTRRAPGKAVVQPKADITVSGARVISISQLTPTRRLSVGRGIAFRFITGSAAPIYARFESALISRGSMHTRVRASRSCFRLKTYRCIRAGG